MSNSRSALRDEGYAYTNHHLLQIMAVFYVLLRRPNMQTRYKKHLWYIQRLCQLIDENLLNNRDNTIYPYRPLILQTVEAVSTINQPDLFWSMVRPVIAMKTNNSKHKNHMGDTYNIQINGTGDFIAGGGTKNVTYQTSQTSQTGGSSFFAYIDLTSCTPKEAKQAEEMLRDAVRQSPKELANLVRTLEKRCLLRKIENVAGFVREFNNHFGADLKEQSFYSAY